MSKRISKKQIGTLSKKSLRRQNESLKMNIEELDQTLNAYEKMKKMLEKEVAGLKIYESEFRETTNRKIQLFINNIDELEHKIKEELEAKEKILAGQIMLVEEKSELQKRLEELTIELEKYKNVTGIKGKILKALKLEIQGER